MTKLAGHLEEIVSLYNGGMGCVLIGRRYGVTDNAIRERLMQQGVALRKQRSYSHVRTVEDWREEYKKHPKWKGKNSYEMRREKDSGLASFYFAFERWKKSNISDETERRKASKKVFRFKREILTPERIDQIFWRVYLRLQRVPRVRELQKECGGLLRAIQDGRYLEGIRDYEAYLKHHGLPSNYPYHKPYLEKEAVEAAFCECYERNRWRVPLQKRFKKRFPMAMRTIKNRKYDPDIRNYQQFLEHIGAKANYPPNYWKNHPARIRRAFYAGKARLSGMLGNDRHFRHTRNFRFRSMTETQDVSHHKYKKSSKGNVSKQGFLKEYPGAYNAIPKGWYDPQITAWNEFLKSLEEKVNCEHINWWTPERIRNAFYGCKSELGRVPTYKELEQRFGGAIAAIKRGKYDSYIFTYNRFLESLGEKINKVQPYRERIY